MDENLIKSLTSLIDETISEIEDLKKSRFAASEVKIEGPGDGIDGKPVNGKIGKKEDEEDDEKDEKDEKEEVEKGVNDEAEKSEDAEKSEEAEKAEKAKEEDEKEDEDKDEKEIEKSEPEADDLKKSLDERDELLKSMFNEAIGNLNDKIAGIMEVVEKMADQPVERKGINHVVPLKKNDDEEVAPLAKADVANKLFELKKSGESVDSADIAAAETGGDLQAIISKYNLKGDK